MARPAKRRRGRPSKPPASASSQYSPEFFKIYLPEHNSKQLLIPPDFIKNFKGKTPNKVILKNLKGKVWTVELEKVGCKLLMQKGWEGFVIGNSLERGEFIIFTYKGKSEFIVKIFSINGCEKIMATYGQPHVKVEELNLDKTYSHHTEACEKTHSERSKKDEQVTRASPEVMTTVASESNIDLKKIRFTKVILEARRYQMNIPASILTEFNIEGPGINGSKTVLLNYHRGVSHTVKLLQRKQQILITAGWGDFQSMNNLVDGDECDFEITLGAGRKIKEIELLQIHHSTTVTQNFEIILRPRNR